MLIHFWVSNPFVNVKRLNYKGSSQATKCQKSELKSKFPNVEQPKLCNRNINGERRTEAPDYFLSSLDIHVVERSFCIYGLCLILVRKMLNVFSIVEKCIGQMESVLSHTKKHNTNTRTQTLIMFNLYEKISNYRYHSSVQDNFSHFQTKPLVNRANSAKWKTKRFILSFVFRFEFIVYLSHVNDDRYMSIRLVFWLLFSLNSCVSYSVSSFANWFKSVVRFHFERICCYCCNVCLCFRIAVRNILFKCPHVHGSRSSTHPNEER